jgi:lactate dehydrogenase-like 2-hydroxyacid dehydrogenase
MSGRLLRVYDRVDEELPAATGDQLEVIESFQVGTDHFDRGLIKQPAIRIGYKQ